MCDITLALLGLIVGLPLFMLVWFVAWCDTGSAIFRQKRVGQYKKTFTLMKFRTMHRGTAQLASHETSIAAVTHVGRFLRRTKLDELPQLWNVLWGRMSLVGPRPCLLMQTELIAAREALGVYQYRPGITGLAQINRIDMSNPRRLAKIDAQMMKNLTLQRYFLYLTLTALGRGTNDPTT
ncbi:MAG: sugar transferase [Planctomycetota bacterium]|nr:MAG: sugar transferase [Planctomycetota bacterium]